MYFTLNYIESLCFIDLYTSFIIDLFTFQSYSQICITIVEIYRHTSGFKIIFFRKPAKCLQILKAAILIRIIVVLIRVFQFYL